MMYVFVWFWMLLKWTDDGKVFVLVFIQAIVNRVHGLGHLHG